jgi:hypothetical protein
VIEDVRALIQDNPSDEALRRWSDTSLTGWTNDATDTIRRRRPDCRFDPDTGKQLSPTIVATGGSLWIPPKWRVQVVNYVCHRAYLRDSEDSVNARLAELYWVAFTEGLS